jgi:hypothetical protein
MVAPDADAVKVAALPCPRRPWRLDAQVTFERRQGAVLADVDVDARRLTGSLSASKRAGRPHRRSRFSPSGANASWNMAKGGGAGL